MSGYYRQMRQTPREAAHGLRQRLARREMGDAAYEEMISHAGDRAFRRFGVAFIAGFAAVILAVVLFGY